MSSSSWHRNSVFRSVYYAPIYKANESTNSLVSSTKDSLDYVQRLGLHSKLDAHAGCVNTVHWNRTGQLLLSGSDDQHLAITNPFTEQILLRFNTFHRANIFSARFMPHSNDLAMVSCSGDGIVLVTELMAPYIRRDYQYIRPLHEAQMSSGGGPPHYKAAVEMERNLNIFNCHKSGTSYEVLTVPDEPRSFMSCGEDGTVRYFDLRILTSCQKNFCKENILVLSPTPVNAMDISPVSHNYLAVGSSDSIVRIYDRRFLSVCDFRDCTTSAKEHQTRPLKVYPIPLPTRRPFRITCVRFSPDESQLLVSFSSEYLYLYDLNKWGFEVEELQAYGFYPDIIQARGDGIGGELTPEQVTRRLRLRGDWSDTGPDARPEREVSGAGSSVSVGQVRPQLQANLMSRMTEAISRMLSDPRTRLGLSALAPEMSDDFQNSLLEAATGPLDAERREQARERNASLWRSLASMGRGQRDSRDVGNQTGEHGVRHANHEQMVVERGSNQAEGPRARHINAERIVVVNGSGEDPNMNRNQARASDGQHNEPRQQGARRINADEIAMVNGSGEASINARNQRASRQDGSVVEAEGQGARHTNGNEVQVGNGFQDGSAPSNDQGDAREGIADNEAGAPVANENDMEGPIGMGMYSDSPGISPWPERDIGMFENNSTDTSSSSSSDSIPSPSAITPSSEAAAIFQADLAEFEKDKKAQAEVFTYAKMKYVGHRNARTMIKEANFWGNDYVMSGSDCGHIFIWNRHTGKLVKLIQADKHVVNCLQPHPELPYLASSGIDYDVKLWAPNLQESDFDEEKAEELMKRNAVMLEETKDTITVPAAFLVRMLTCIHSLRTRERRYINFGGYGNPTSDETRARNARLTPGTPSSSLGERQSPGSSSRRTSAPDTPDAAMTHDDDQ